MSRTWKVTGKVVAVLLAVIALTLITLQGVTDKGFSEAPTTKSPTNAAIAFWLNGSQVEAMQLMLESGAMENEGMRSVPELEMSESDFMSLSTRQQSVANETNIAIGNAARALVRALIAHAQASDDVEEDRRIKALVLEMADELDSPEHTLLIRQQGKTLRKIAEGR